MKKLVCSAVLASVLFGGAAMEAPVSAQGASTVIRYADLNLGNEHGLATLRGRIKAAADRVCGSAPALPAGRAHSVEACRDEVFRSAEAQVSAARSSGIVEVLGTR